MVAKEVAELERAKEVVQEEAVKAQAAWGAVEVEATAPVGKAAVVDLLAVMAAGFLVE